MNYSGRTKSSVTSGDLYYFRTSLLLVLLHLSLDSYGVSFRDSYGSMGRPYSVIRDGMERTGLVGGPG